MRPRWPTVSGTLLSLGGLGVSGYLTYAHYTSTAVFACPEDGVVNCAKVTTSSYSHLAGIPLALLGIVYFATMALLQSPPLWRSTRPALRTVRVLTAAAGTAMALRLVDLQLLGLDAICLYCTAALVITILLLVVTSIGTAWSSAVPAPGSDLAFTFADDIAVDHTRALGDHRTKRLKEFGRSDGYLGNPGNSAGVPSD